MLYNSVDARAREQLVRDVAIFPFDGDNEGVDISDIEVEHNASQIGAAIGYPAKYHEDWKEALHPFISVGKIFTPEPPELNPLMERIYAENGIKHEPGLNIYYGGITLRGNSGGPLIDSEGKVIGICQREEENGIKVFGDFRPILREVTQAQ